MQLYGRITYGFSCSPARRGVADITDGLLDFFWCLFLFNEFNKFLAL